MFNLLYLKIYHFGQMDCVLFQFYDKMQSRMSMHEPPLHSRILCARMSSLVNIKSKAQFLRRISILSRSSRKAAIVVVRQDERKFV